MTARIIHSLLLCTLLGFIWATQPRINGGIYSPDEPCFFDEFDSEGYAKPLGFSNFNLLLTEILSNDLKYDPADPARTPVISKNRQKLLDRIELRKKKGLANLPSEELAGLTADMIRLGGNFPEEALNLLQPISQDRRRADFFVLTHTARIHEERGEWDSAYRRQSSALTDYPFPKKFGSLSESQLKWLRRVERNFYLPLMLSRRLEVDAKRTGVQENVDPLFPQRSATPDWSPVRYQAEDGSYVAGIIDPKEKSKLPPDAIAILQQMVFWNPKDPRLFWQLGEVYNANGDFETALKIFDACVDDPRNYANKTLMEHRAIIRDLIESRKREEERKRQQQEDEQQRRYWIVGGIVSIVVVVLFLLQIRQIRRRRRLRS